MRKRSVRSKKSANVFTGRLGNQGFFVKAVIFFLALFTAVSAFAIIQQPESPAAWSMATFFALLLAMVLGFEENMFPNLAMGKVPTAVITWFFAFIFVAFFVAFLTTMTFAYLVVAAMFGLIVFIAGTYTIASEEQWGKFKESVASNTTRKISKSVGKKLPKRKKRKKPKRKKKTRIARW
jgi:signal transduction histidine kinase